MFQFFSLLSNIFQLILRSRENIISGEHQKSLFSCTTLHIRPPFTLNKKYTNAILNLHSSPTTFYLNIYENIFIKMKKNNTVDCQLIRFHHIDIAPINNDFIENSSPKPVGDKRNSLSALGDNKHIKKQ